MSERDDVNDTEDHDTEGHALKARGVHDDAAGSGRTTPGAMRGKVADEPDDTEGHGIKVRF